MHGYAVLVVLLVSITLTVVSVLISLDVNRKSERKMCKLVSSSIEAYEETPPSTVTGENVKLNLIELQREFHCPPKGILK